MGGQPRSKSFAEVRDGPPHRVVRMRIRSEKSHRLKRFVVLTVLEIVLIVAIEVEEQTSLRRSKGALYASKGNLEKFFRKRSLNLLRRPLLLNLLFSRSFGRFPMRVRVTLALLVAELLKSETERIKRSLVLSHGKLKSGP
jgi:hypothetical protein